MKLSNVLFSLVTATVLASCVHDGYYSENYISNCNFDWYNFVSVNPDSIYNAGYLVEGQSMVFNVKLDESKKFAGGFTFSWLCDTVLEAGHVTRSEYCVSDTTGAEKTKGFAVFTQNSNPELMPEHDIIFTAYYNGGEAQPVQVYVCNTNKVANLILYGDENIEPFASGDYLTVTFNAYRDGQKTGSKSVDLARYDGKGSKVVYVWEKLDLSGLGAFEAIDLELSTNRSDIPLMCCIDNFTANVSISY